ncbi:hypothetical protein [Salipiger sp. PrR002]|uniref:hypothetical protein n=1 Tax=Salipiger sp. PrR002 TaxID=2706489 RepID=UPI00194136A4|nr:hypothetical protein [Salipiger sp. PrR002]
MSRPPLSPRPTQRCDTTAPRARPTRAAALLLALVLSLPFAALALIDLVWRLFV